MISLSPTAALLYYGLHEAARLEAIDTVTGQSVWASPAFGRLFDARSDRYETGVLETPLDGQVWLRDQLVVMSGEHVGIVERFGRAAVFDRATGALVMAQQLDVPMIYEAALEGLLLGAVLLWLAYRRGALKVPGQLMGLFFAGYGGARFFVEYFRQGDWQFVTPENPNGEILLGLTTGQWLSLPMLIFGLIVIAVARAQAHRVRA